MEFKVDVDVLADAIELVKGAVPSKSVLPILSHVLFDIHGTGIRFLATDLETRLQTDIECEVEKGGQLAVPVDKLAGLLRSIDEGVMLTCSVDESHHMRILAGEGEYTIPCVAGAEYSTAHVVNETDTIELPVNVLRDSLAYTMFSVSGDELRPALTGILFDVSAGGVTAVATNGHTLARYHTNGGKVFGERSVIVPAKTAKLLVKGLPENGTVTLKFDKTWFEVDLGGVVMGSRLIEGRFPNYASVIPSHEHSISAGVKALGDAVKRVSVFANKISHTIMLDIADHKAELQAEDVEVGGRGREALKVVNEGKLEGRWGVNAGYVKTVLGMIPDETVRIGMGEPTQALTFAPVAADGMELLFLVMPVRLN